MAARLNCVGPDNPLFLWSTHHTNNSTVYDAMTAAISLIASGELLHIGLCNATVAQIEMAYSVVGPSLLCIQNEYVANDGNEERSNERATEREAQIINSRCFALCRSLFVSLS